MDQKMTVRYFYKCSHRNVRNFPGKLRNGCQSNFCPFLAPKIHGSCHYFPDLSIIESFQWMLVVPATLASCSIVVHWTVTSSRADLHCAHLLILGSNSHFDFSLVI